METWQEFLLANRAWVNEKTAVHKNYFEYLSRAQQPKAFWIGCCDSRVPAEEIVGAQPGTIFVHRNVANQVRPDDPNLMVALEYAVRVLKIREIIICGHYDCGGVLAASGADTGLEAVERWIHPIRQNLIHPKMKVDGSVDVDSLVERNVLTQLEQLHGLLNSMLEKIPELSGEIKMHGWVFNLRNGTIGNLKSVKV